MPHDAPEHGFSKYLWWAELAIYYLVGLLLVVAALAAAAGTGRALWDGIVHPSLSTESLRVLGELLLVLMLVEILHTVRISIRSHILLATEPFLIVGLIASIRRVLMISLEMTTLTKEGSWAPDGAAIFRSSMIELGLLIVLIPVLVLSIAVLRRYVPNISDLANDPNQTPSHAGKMA